MPPTPDRAPTARLLGPETLTVGVEAIFDGSTSSDDRPSGIKSWVLRDSTGTEHASDKGHPPASIKATPTEPGITDFLLTVWDAKGNPDTCTLTYDVQPVPVPVDCVLGDPVIVSETPLEVCQPDGFQAVEVAWTKPVLVEPANGGEPCGVRSGTRIEKRACVYVPPDPGPDPGPTPEPVPTQTKWPLVLPADPDIVAISQHPKTIIFYPLRSQQELDSHKTRACGDPARFPVVYSPTHDGALLVVDPNGSTDLTPRSGAGNVPCQKHLSTRVPLDKSISIGWEFTFDGGWQYKPDRIKFIEPDGSAVLGVTDAPIVIEGEDRPRHYLDQCKTWRGDPPESQRWRLWLSVKTQWINAYQALYPKKPPVVINDPSAVAELLITDVGGYGPGEQDKTLPNALTRAFIYANRLTKLRLYFEAVGITQVANRDGVLFDATRYALSAWLWDAVQGRVQLYESLPYDACPGGLDLFRMEYDISFNQVPALNPRAESMNRHFFVQRDISRSEFERLLP